MSHCFLLVGATELRPHVNVDRVLQVGRSPSKGTKSFHATTVRSVTSDVTSAGCSADRWRHPS